MLKRKKNTGQHEFPQIKTGARLEIQSHILMWCWSNITQMTKQKQENPIKYDLYREVIEDKLLFISNSSAETEYFRLDINILSKIEK